jgi:hypothetical protein
MLNAAALVFPALLFSRKKYYYPHSDRFMRDRMSVVLLNCQPAVLYI